MSQPHTLGQIAERYGLDLHGDPELSIDGVGTLRGAGASQISFLANPAYRVQLAHCRAAAVVLREADRAAAPGAALVSANPYAAFARIAAEFESRQAHLPGIHPSAAVDPEATIDPSAHIGAHCSIGARTQIAAGAVLGPGCIIGHDCVIGVDALLVARVTLVTRVRLGARVIVHPGAVLGADGFGIAMDQGRWLKVPQLGGVVIGDDCEIGANTTIDRGALDDTVLEDDVRLDNQIQIGHNVRIGAHTALAGCVAVAGSVQIGRYCLIGGGAGIAGHLSIADHVSIHAMSLVSHSIRTSGTYASGTALEDAASWRRNMARLRRLDQFVRRSGAARKATE